MMWDEILNLYNTLQRHNLLELKSMLKASLIPHLACLFVLK